MWQKESVFPAFLPLSDDPPLLGRAGMQFLLGEEKIWNKCGEFFRRRRKELDEFTGYVVGALQPIVLAVYRVLCPHLFCKFSDDLKGML